MRVFAKNDLGLYPASWSIEDQAWYDALLVECGLSDTQTRFVPKSDEIALEQAIAIAISHINNEFGDSTDVTDEMLYQRLVEYRQFAEQDKSIGPPKWYIRYESLDPTLNSFDFTIASNGAIEEARCEPGVKGAYGTPSVEAVFDYYTETYGMHYEFSQDVWVELQRDIKRAAAEHGHTGNLSKVILRQQYGVPDAQAIPLEKAVEAARNAIAQESGLPATELEANYTPRALYLLDKDGVTWKVNFVNTVPNGSYAFTLRYAEVDADTGEVRNTGYYQPGVNRWYEAYVLISTLQEASQMPSHG